MKVWAVILRIFLFIVGMGGVIGILSLFSASIAWSILVVASLGVTSLITISYLYFGVFFNEAIFKHKRLLELTVVLHFFNQLLALINAQQQLNQIKLPPELLNQNLLVPLLIGISIYAIWIYWIEKVSAWKANQKGSNIVQ
jgi:hypothetical protein